MMKNLIVSNTVKRTAIWYGAVLVMFYLLFSILTLIELNFILVEDLDSRLSHELEHIIHTLEIIDDSVSVIHRRELDEPDLNFITDNPYFLQVYNLKGSVKIQSENINIFGDIDLGFPNKFNPYYFEDQYAHGEQLRSIYKELLNHKNQKIGYIQLSVFQSSFSQITKSIIYINLISFPIILLIVTLISILLAKKSYEPINKIIETANSISATNLSKRLDYKAEPNDELEKLKTTLNLLFERLENQVKEISQFTDNASHQLMTPLTAIKSELDFILKRQHEISEYQDTCRILKDQTDRMITMMKTMLIMSKEFNTCTDNSTVFSLNNLIDKEISKIFYKPNIIYNISDNIYLRGKPENFSLVLQNLISNAIKYSPNNYIVNFIAYKKDNQIIIKVTDTGIGIKESEKQKIFQRFYRSDNEAIQNVDGYGLGLSLVKSVVESMRGNISVTNNFPQGSIFLIELPEILIS